MTNPTDADRLIALLKAALDEADARGNTLVAAHLAECIDAAERSIRFGSDRR